MKGLTGKPHTLAYDLANKIYSLFKEKGVKIYPED